MPTERALNIEGLLDAEDKQTNLDEGHMQREASLKQALVKEDPEEASAYEQSKAAHKRGQSNPMRHIGVMRYFA